VVIRVMRLAMRLCMPMNDEPVMSGVMAFMDVFRRRREERHARGGEHEPRQLRQGH